MPDVAFDRFYRYDELTEILQGWAEERPELFRVESIGKSYEGRDIWLATVTNFETGTDLDALIATSQWLEGALGRRLEGQVYRAGAWAGD